MARTLRLCPLVLAALALASCKPEGSSSTVAAHGTVTTAATAPASASPSPADGWIEGKLAPAKASFPDKPTRATRKQAGPEGPMDVQTLRLTRGTTDMGMQLVVDPNPGAEAKADPQSRLDGARDVFQRGLGATEVALDEHITLAGLPARHLKLVLPEGHGTTELVIVYPRPDTMVIAMVAWASPPSAEERAESKRFFDSFTIEATP